jgi:serine/threonine protein kinase/tetratricopeptide (TPR) repeat protein
MATNPADPPAVNGLGSTEPHVDTPPGTDDRTIAVFLAAMSQPAADRSSFIAEACLGDDSLLAQVQRRVDWEARMNGFLLRPVSRERFDRPFSSGDLLLNRFRVVRVAGEGGMGTVYEAVDEKLGHRIALKCPRFEFRKRLSPEALQSLRVTHPNVCRVYEIHTCETPHGDVDFLTMEFLEGETMAARLASAPPRWLGTAEGAAIARQVCAGLSAVHAQGVIHRDLKPSNVMLSSDTSGAPRAVIMDFGLAQGFDLTNSQIRGTPAYFAPELWMGHRASVQSDLYALAVLLFEMACGHKPFPEAAPWNQRLRTVPSAEGLRGPIRAALIRCLDPDPTRRFANVEEFSASLWPALTRRRAMIGGLALMASGAAGLYLKSSLWPTSPVRLAMLPPVIDPPDPEASSLLRGFVHDLSYRLKTLRGARRPLTVISDIPGKADVAALGATHQLETRMGDSRRFSARLLDSRTHDVLAGLEDASTETLGVQLFAMQTAITTRVIDALQLGADSPRDSGLNAAIYPVYLNALRIAREEYERASSAIPLFQQVVSAAPNSALAHAGLAEALVNTRFVERKPELETPARLALERAEQLDPHLPQVHLMTGRMEMIAGYYERARTSYRRAAEISPNEPQVYISMSYPAYMTNRFDEAEASLNTAIRLNPSYYKPYVDAGFLAQQRRQFSLAEQHWRQAIRLAPATHVASRVNLAEVLVQTGRDAEAETVIDEAEKIQTTPLGLQLRGDLRARQGRLADAIELYEKAIALQPPDYRLWSHLGTYYQKAGRSADAERAFRRGIVASEAKLTSNRRQPDVLSLLALYHAKLGERAPIASLAAEAHSLAGHNQWTVCKLLALAYSHTGEISAAVDLLKNAPADLMIELAFGPDTPPELRRQTIFQR